MFSNHRSTNKIIALFVFISALVLYVITMAPTASFWDSGEFIAVAYGLEVNHPPGAPLYTLLGRLFSMFIPQAYVAISVNFISTLASALTVMLLYLIIVRLVREFKGYKVSEYLVIDRIGMHGGAIVGAFAFAVTDTFWFSAVEAEVYAVSMFFTAIVIWLALKWSENHEKPNNERWLLLIAYMFGLALGVHLLNLLALFFVGLIVYFKKKDFALLSMAVAGAIAVISFFLIYPFTVQWLPSMMENLEQASYGLIGPITFTILVIAVLACAIYFTHKNNYRLANFILLCYTLILIGYSSYALIFIRSMANPPIDENNPETSQSFINYLERKQYGQTPLFSGYDYDETTGRINRDKTSLFPRRYSSAPNHLQQYANYSSDWDYFLDYQLDHMYIRYFNWNFIGRDSDIQDAGWQAGFTESDHAQNPAHNSYFYLPFLLGLFGMLFHFQSDWKRALSVLVLFLMTGVAIIIFLNQTPMQPRERDYAYVGSFFAFAIWIGMGGVGLVEMVKEYLKSNQLAAYAVIGLLFLGVPAQMCYQNFNDHDRSDRYVASDYAYNLLQSVDYGGIVFTNGDNDTFPLWYAQEVEGVRTDVRVVCLSLLNTDWYIKQLRDQWSHESAPLPISLTDEEINEITSSRYLHEPDTVRIPVNKSLLRSAFTDSSRYREVIGVNSHPSTNIYRPAVDFGMPVDSLDNEVTWYYKGRPAGQDQQGNKRYYTQVQDDVILNILKTNKWLRPVYFANTVSTTSQMNLQNYFRFEGNAYRVVPERHDDVSRFGYVNPSIMTDTYRKFRFRKWNKPGNYLDDNIRRRIVGNYQLGLSELANAYIQENKPDSAVKWLQWGEKNILLNNSFSANQSSLLFAQNYLQAGDIEDAERLAKKNEKPALRELKNYVNQYEDLQSQVGQLNNDIKKARASADMQARRNLQQRIQNFQSRRQSIGRNISNERYNLMLIQHIYYLNNDDQRAAKLAEKVNKVGNGLFEFPDSKAKSDKEFSNFQ